MKLRIVSLLLGLLFLSINTNPIFATTITVKAPNGGGTLGAGASTNITWETTGTLENVKIDLTTDNGNTWDTITTGIPSTGTYAWTVPAVTSDSCKIKVSDVQPGGPSDESDSVFKIIDLRRITITSPNGGEELEVGTRGEATWNTLGIIDSVKIEFSENNGDNWIIFTSKTVDTGSYTFYIPDKVSNSCLLKVSDASDMNISDICDANFTIHNPNIEIIVQSGIPKINSLIGFGPNPVKNQLSISFCLAQSENVLIDIYSLKGRLIKCLANERLSAGYYKVLWNSEENSGQSISAGPYLLKMEIGDMVHNKILTIIK